MNMFSGFFESVTNNQEKLLGTRNAAQFELAEKKGVDFGAWLDMRYHDDFRKIVEQDPEILERLADEKTHNETIEEIANKLYH